MVWRCKQIAASRCLALAALVEYPIAITLQMCPEEDTDERAESSAEDSDEETRDTNPLNCVAPEILDGLGHLDLTGYVDFKENKVISGGAMGDICRARCMLPGRGKVKVAIKRLRFYLKEDVKTLFEKEIYVWAKLKHPNILPLLGFAFDIHAGFPLLVSEWMKNGSAWNFVLSHPGCDLMRIVTGIAQGLAYLHANGVVHSDIKSDNILITKSEDAQICDFGCSRMLAASQSFANLTTGIKGTPQYLAYELLAIPGSRHSKETDVWAFGMTVFELLARERPYANLQTAQVLTSILKLELPSLPTNTTSLVSPETKKTLWDTCQLCWNHDPIARPVMDHIVARLAVGNRASRKEDEAIGNKGNREAAGVAITARKWQSLPSASDHRKLQTPSTRPHRVILGFDAPEEQSTDGSASQLHIDHDDKGDGAGSVGATGALAISDDELAVGLDTFNMNRRRSRWSFPPSKQSTSLPLSIYAQLAGALHHGPEVAHEDGSRRRILRPKSKSGCSENSSGYSSPRNAEHHSDVCRCNYCYALQNPGMQSELSSASNSGMSTPLSLELETPPEFTVLQVPENLHVFRKYGSQRRPRYVPGQGFQSIPEDLP